MSEVECAGLIQKTAEQHFNQLIPRLCKSDFEVAQLEKQVRELKLRRMARMNGNSRDVGAEHKIELDKINEGTQNSGEMCVPRIESMKPVELPDDNYLDCLSSKGQSIRTVRITYINSSYVSSCFTYYFISEPNFEWSTDNRLRTRGMY